MREKIMSSIEQLQSNGKGYRHSLPFCLTACLILSQSLMGQSNFRFVACAMSPMVKVFPEGDNVQVAQKEIVLFAARNEYEPFQAVIANKGGPLHNVGARISPLVHVKAPFVKLENVELRVVAYLDIKKSSWRGVKRIGRWPDPLLNMRSFDVPKGEVRSLWGTVYVPDGVPPGDYKGELIIEVDGLPPQVIPLRLHVWDFSLPRETHLRTSFWLDKLMVQRAYKKTDMPFAFWQKFYDLFGTHRISTDAWGDGRKDHMVKIYREPSGKFTCDISELQKHISYTIEKCHFNIVNVGNGCWGSSHFSKIVAIDRISGRRIQEGIPREVSNKMFEEYLNAICSWLKQKGWLDKAYIQLWDEPNRKTWEWGVKKAYHRVEAIRPDLKKLCVVGVHPELQGYFEIWTPHTLFYDRETYSMVQNGLKLSRRKSFPAKVSASSSGGWGNAAFYTYRPIDCYDGCAYTYWTTAKPPTIEKPQWLNIAFNQPSKINGIVILPKENREPKRWRLLACKSSEGKEFVPVKIRRDGGEWTFRFRAMTVSQLRLEFLAAAQGEAPQPESKGVGIREIEVVGPGAPREATIQREKTKPVEIWEYNVGADYPSFCVDANAMEHRAFPWICWDREISGYLYYGGARWPKLWADSGIVEKQPIVWHTEEGDTGGAYLIYPGKEGPIPSIRFALMREGIEDYEYLYMLSELTNGNDPLLDFRETRWHLLSDPQELMRRRREIAERIELLSTRQK